LLYPRWKHFLITRFNPWLPWLQRKGPSEEWLDRRFQLFESFCFPSVVAQTNNNFTWLVFFDIETPDKFKRRISRYTHLPMFTPVFVDCFTPDTVREVVRNYLDKDVRHILSTRLDNDDAISKYYLDAVQRESANSTEKFINFPSGYNWWNNRLYRKQDFCNPFFSMVESVDEFQSGYAFDHTRIAEAGLVRQVASAPVYMQVIHGENVASQLPKRPMPALKSRARGSFPLAVLHKREDWRALIVDACCYGLSQAKQRARRWCSA
jgi:hypothetical protein